MRSFTDALQDRFGERYTVGEHMKNHTTFRIGGPADYMVLPETEDEIAYVLRLCESFGVNGMVIGNGSNLVFSDDGYRGVIIKLAKNLSGVEINGLQLTADAGIMLPALARTALDNRLTGLEFASGIPGTLGGAVFMNAGAYGSEIKDVFSSCRVIERTGVVKTLYRDDLSFGYRKSAVQGGDLVITSVTVELRPGSYEDIKNLSDTYNAQRKDKQPLDMPSAGSAFKRPEGFFAGKLIQDAGLKGFSVGGAQVSEKHAGFIVNKGGASSKDVKALVAHIKAVVYDRFNVMLESEIKFI